MDISNLVYFFLHFDLRTDPEPDQDFFPAEPDPDPREMSDPHPWRGVSYGCHGEGVGMHNNIHGYIYPIIS